MIAPAAPRIAAPHAGRAASPAAVGLLAFSLPGADAATPAPDAGDARQDDADPGNALPPLPDATLLALFAAPVPVPVAPTDAAPPDVKHGLLPSSVSSITAPPLLAHADPLQAGGATSLTLPAAEAVVTSAGQANSGQPGTKAEMATAERVPSPVPALVLGEPAVQARSLPTPQLPTAPTLSVPAVAGDAPAVAMSTPTTAPPLPTIAGHVPAVASPLPPVAMPASPAQLPSPPPPPIGTTPVAAADPASAPAAIVSVAPVTAAPAQPLVAEAIVPLATPTARIEAASQGSPVAIPTEAPVSIRDVVQSQVAPSPLPPHWQVRAPTDATPASALAPAMSDPAEPRARGDAAGDLLASVPAPLAAAAPAVAAPAGGERGTLDLRQDAWPQGMIRHIERLQDAADAADTRIRLLPDALGSVDVDVRRDGDVLHVRFSAEQAQTRALIQDAQPRLAEAAEQRGLRLGQASVDAGASGQSQGRSPQQTAAPRPAPSRRPERDAPAADDRIA